MSPTEVVIDPAFLVNWGRYIADVSARARRREDMIKLFEITEREGLPPPLRGATDRDWAIFWFKAATDLARHHDPTFRPKPSRLRAWSEMRLCELVADFWYEKGRGPERSERDICAFLASSERYAGRWGASRSEGLRKRLKEGLASRFVEGIVLGDRPPEQRRELRDTFISLFRLS